AQQRPARPVGCAAQDRGVRHPLGVRVGLPVAPHRRDDAAARPRVQGSRRRRALPAPGKLPHLGRICRLLPAGVRGAGRGHGSRRMSAPEPRRAGTRVLQVVLPLVLLALAVAIWHGVVTYRALPPYVLPSPVLVARTLFDDWSILS